MIEKFIIWAPQIADERDSLVELREEDRVKIRTELKKLDDSCKTPVNDTVIENSYQNDDYLLVAGLLQEVRNIHKKIYYNIYKSEWMCGHKEIPYIHFDFFEYAPMTQNEYGETIPNDKGLNICVKESPGTDAYRVEFNYYWLKQYLKFLQKIFDSNEEMIYSIRDEINTGSITYKTRNELLLEAKHIELCGLKIQADVLRRYANSALDSNKIAEPCLVYLEKEKLYTWGFYGENGKAIKIPMKKTIYNTSGFVGLFDRRSELVKEIFQNSIKMVLGHETAHVARGHWNLRKKENEYSLKRNVMINCEINADWTAAIWMINELLYDTANGDSNHNILALKRNELIQLWTIRIFSIYLSLSWVERNADRSWSGATLEYYVNKSEATHPAYQFRLYCVLNKIREHLMHLAEKNQETNYQIRTLDNTELDQKLFDTVWKNACDMIFSFEYAFRDCWNLDERTELEKIRQGLFIIDDARPKDNRNVPFLMCYMDKAQKELELYEQEWPKVLDELRKCGMYFRM